MLRQRITYIFMTIINIFVFLFTNSKIPLVTAVVLVVSPIISYIFLQIVAAQISIECDIQGSVWEGDAVDIRLSLVSALNLYPGMFSVKRYVKSIMFGDDKEMEIKHELGYKSHIVNVGFKSLYCGMHTVEIYDLRLYDLLQLFSVEKNFKIKKDITVYPRSVNLSTVLRNEATVEHEGYMYDKNRKGSDHSEIFELREYANGDDIRSIHWKLSSKMNRPVVREFSRPSNRHIILVCDMSLKFNDEKISNKAVSDNLAITTAISASMAKRGMEYRICAIGERILETVEVRNGYNKEGMKMRNAFLNVPLSDGECNSALILSNSGELQGVSRMIFVSKEFDIETLNKMSSYIDITVVTTNDDESVNYADSRENGFEIISIGSSELYNRTHYVAL